VLERAHPVCASPTNCNDPSRSFLYSSTKRTLRLLVLGTKINIQGKINSAFWFIPVIDKKSYRCACDVPAHNYTYSWEPKLDWSAVYAGSAEINKYFNDFAAKYGLDKYIKMNHQVIGAKWDDKKGQWDVQILDLVSGNTINNSCDILVNASGILNAWRWPAIPGIAKYKGKLLHSANWDASVELEGKHVGLIGNGYVYVIPTVC
jgi:hypothetical protein